MEGEIKKEGVELSSASHLISDTCFIGGVKVFPEDFIPDLVGTDPLYEETSLIKSPYSFEYQEVNNKTGKRKFVWKNPVPLACICNPIEVGTCENIAVFLKGKTKPLIFPNGEITLEAFRRQTTFARKGINVSVQKHFESFLRSLQECPNKKFLLIPKHAGGVTLPDGVTTYLSADSVIPGLEELFPQEVRDHKMVAHALSLKDTAAIYRKAVSTCLEAALATTVRVESILLPLFGAEGLHPDRGFVISYSNDSARETVIALTKRKNYSSTVVQALTDRITKVRHELAAANDVTVLLTYSGIFEEGYNLDNAFKEVLWDLTGENGDEDKTRKIIMVITDRPERIPEDYPVYYFNSREDIISDKIHFLQHISGIFDYSFMEYMKNNPDITILDIKNYIVQYNDDGELVLDEAHKKLRLKLMAVLDELEDIPQRKNNWGEFLKEQGKPIVVISTGADNVGKGSEIIDMMLENLYSYKQCYPDSRYTVVIDEAQDLYLHEKGAVNVLLRKGGKHRITMLLASQSFPESNVQFGKVVGNCGRLRSYHPKADDLKRTAEYFNCGRDEVDYLKQGECYDKGPFWSRYRAENVITTLKGKTVKFEPAPDMNNNEQEDKEQSCGCSEGGENNGKEGSTHNTASQNLV